MNGIKDWLGLAAAVVGLLVGVKLLVANPIEARLDRMETRINARLDAQQAESNRRFDVILERMNADQAENNRRFDALLEAVMDFDRRVARLEGRLDAQDEEPAE